MFEYIKGTLASRDGEAVIIDNNGIGYKVFISLGMEKELPQLHHEIKVLLYPVYKEDDIQLFGFAEVEERALFKTLIGVSGIGPKAAMGLLSFYTGDELIRHIQKGDTKAITRAPGIGKKTAERIVLELKDKYKTYAVNEPGDEPAGAVGKMRAEDNLFNEAVNGLMGLGFSYAEAYDQVDAVLQPGMRIEAVLQAALQRMGS